MEGFSQPLTRRRFLVTAAASAVLSGSSLVLAACSTGTNNPAASVQPTVSTKAASGARPITIAWGVIASDYGPYWFAAEKGLFLKRGVNVALTFIAPGAATQALVSHSIDILSTSGEGINLKAGNVDVKYFGTLNHSLPFGFYSRKGGATSISPALAGQSVAVTSSGSATDIFAREFLTQKGVDPAKMQFVYTQDIPAILAGLTSGKVDMGAIPTPVSFQAESNPSITTIAATGSVRVPGTTGSLLAFTDWIRSHENEAKSIMQALLDGIGFAKDNPVEAQQILGKYMKLDDQALLKRTYDFSLKLWGPTLEADKEGLRVALKYAANPKAKSITVDDLIYENNKLANSLARDR